MTALNHVACCGLLVGCTLIGCGGGDEAAPQASNSAKSSQTTASKGSGGVADSTPEWVSEGSAGDTNVPPPPASIGTPQSTTIPAEGTPAWYLFKIKQVRGAAAPETTDLARLREIRHKRNEEIIDLAMQVIVKTHSNPQQEELFTQAAMEFMEACLQNALQGSQEDVETLYSEASSLQERDPDSASAMYATYAIVRFAHTNARLYSSQEPKWIEEFSRQARMFAGRYPEEASKSLPLLSAAALTAEMHGQRQEAVACHTLLAEKFPETPQGRFSVGVLRRFNLEGRPLEFAGPTLEGGFISLDKDYTDKVVLIVFWRSDDEDFLAQLPTLKTLYDKYNKFGFEIIGVSLDEDELVLNQWLEEHDLSWRQIFFAQKEQRGWRNLVAQFYGVKTVPTLWLVDHTGVVKDSQVDSAALEASLRDLLLALRNKTNSASIESSDTSRP